MKRLPLCVVMALFATASAHAQLQEVLVAKRGSKCLTALAGRVVGAACTGNPDQTITPNFSVGGLQVLGQCLRRASWSLTLAPCRAGDVAEVFEVDGTTQEISNAAGARGCVELGGGAAEWRPSQPIDLGPCRGSASQKWLAAMVKTSAGRGAARPNDAQVELRSGDYIVVGGKFLVVK